MGHVFRLKNCLKMEMLTLKSFSGSEHIVPNQWVWVFLEGFYLDPGSGNWTTLMANGTEIAVNASLVNPVAPSGSSASTVLDNGVGSYVPQSS